MINDLVTDNRLHKVCVSLQSMGFEPLLIGRVLPVSQPVERVYATHRMKLIFSKGPLFYLEYNIRLLLFLLQEEVDVLVANDLDTLAANYLASRIKGKPLIYDSHEYFTEVPELQGRPLVRKVWKWLENQLVPKVDAAYTVCDSIANVYHDLYHVDFKVVRNLPVSNGVEFISSEILKPANAPKIILYQGALNMGRGIESAIRAMQLIDGAELWLAGDGDLTVQLKQLVVDLQLEEKVKFLGRQPINQLSEVTRQADLGLSLEEDLGLNYRFALPNKLFDYIQSCVPILVSDLPEMRHIVERYQIGAIAESHEVNALSQKIMSILFDAEQNRIWKENLKIAAKELCWENEEAILSEIYTPFL